ncbi:MAG: alpha/beta hydrolase [Pseudomonadota bacterium]
MNRQMMVLAAGMAGVLITTPIFAPTHAQRSGGRPSSSCVQEIMRLCGRDRSQIPACLQSKGSSLSSKCQKEVAARMGQRMEQANGAAGGFQSGAKPTRTVLYGNEKRQQIDVYEPEGAVDDLPLVLFVHGGAWRMGDHKRVQSKPAHFGAQDIYFASTGYRVLPEAPVEDQAKDVGLAVQALVGQASSIGFDPERIVIMGHSAGAHLAALVSTDPQYAGDAFDAIKGVILLDGAGYDIAKNLAEGAPQAKFMFEEAFGIDPARHAALSPVTYVGGPDAPNWLALYVDTRAPAKAQAELLVGALNEAGSSAKAVAIANTDHGGMNRDIGTETGAAQTQAVDAFLAEIFGS